MNCPPLILRLAIPFRRRRIFLWLPLFLLWPVAAAVVIVLVPLVLLLALIFWSFGWGKLLFFSGPPIYGCLCALRGLEVNVQRGNRLLLISFK